MKPEIKFLPTAAELARAAAAEVVAQARVAVARAGRFTLVLSGGSTPRTLFTLLADEPAFRDALPWTQTHFFWGDERHVAADHVDSNYRMAREAMLAKVPVPETNIHRIPSENPDANAAALAYEQTLRQVFATATGEFPRFDLVLLGMGTDGHTASLFPGTKALAETQRLVVANWVEKLNTWRITLTASSINHAAQVLFLVNGPDKAAPLHAVLQGARQPELYPSQLIQPVNGRCQWWLDHTAAALLGPQVTAETR